MQTPNKQPTATKFARNTTHLRVQARPPFHAPPLDTKHSRVIIFPVTSHLFAAAVILYAFQSARGD